MAILVFGIPIIAAALIVRSRGWRPQPWSSVERRTRMWLALLIAVPLALGCVYVVGFGAWLMGPSCGQHPTGVDRVHVVVFALIVAAFAAAVPVALAGRRPVALIAAAAPVIAALITAFAATSPTTEGWCAF